MARIEADLTGMRFTRWLVLNKSKDGWLCKCDCGTQKTVKTNSLTSGRSRSCGCYSKEISARRGKKNLKDLTGKRFGRLLVEKEAGRDSRGEAFWLCRCHCGNEKKIRGSSLRLGLTTSCGCYRRSFRMRELSGQKFGRLLVLKRGKLIGDYGDYLWHCECDCGNIVEVRNSSLVGGNTKSCGCLNDEQRLKQAANLIGKKFGRLTVKKRIGKKWSKAVLWLSECECGNFTTCVTADLNRGNTTSCGCYSRERTSETHKGEKNVNYNPNLTEEERLGKRDLTQGKKWTRSVLERDRFTCKICGDQRNLVGHHLDGWHWAKNKRFDIKNGVTLCSDCHILFHIIYGPKENTERQFREFKSTYQISSS